MSEIGKVDLLRAKLSEIVLPSLRRPPDTFNSPTQAVVDWALLVYAYSSIAHVRNVLSGLVHILDAGNDVVGFLVCRHLYEWTMHAAYMQEKCAEQYKKQDWKTAFELFVQVDSGNSWIKKHGHKYAPEIQLDELPNQIRINKFVSAYEKYQADFYGRDGDDVRDTYGLLSEHSHPNGACFHAYRKIVAGSYVFGSPDDTALPYPLPYLLDWLICIRKLLSLAKDSGVNPRLEVILREIIGS